MLVGCGAVGVGNTPKTKSQDEISGEQADVKTREQAEVVETKSTDESTNTGAESENTTDLADEELPNSELESSLPVVYMTSDISSAGLMAVYEASDIGS